MAMGVASMRGGYHGDITSTRLPLGAFEATTM